MNDISAIEVTANVKGMGRVQRTVLSALQDHPPQTTAQIAERAFKRAGTFELNSVLRAIEQLSARGFRFSKTRKGRVNATGYVYEWRLLQ